MSLTMKVLPVVFLLCPAAAMADSLFSNADSSRMELHRAQVAVFEKRYAIRTTETAGAAAVSESAAAVFEPAAAASNKTTAEVVLRRLNIKPRGKHVGQYLTEAKRQALNFGIPEALFLALIQQESAWNSNARSPVGAIGLAQLMPDTAKDLKVDPYDPKQNIKGGAKYLRAQYDTFGDWRLALAAYNAGPGAVRKYGGVPPYRETRNYVRRITGE